MPHMRRIRVAVLVLVPILLVSLGLFSALPRAAAVDVAAPATFTLSLNGSPVSPGSYPLALMGPTRVGVHFSKDMDRAAVEGRFVRQVNPDWWKPTDGPPPTPVVFAWADNRTVEASFAMWSPVRLAFDGVKDRSGMAITDCGEVFVVAQVPVYLLRWIPGRDDLAALSEGLMYEYRGAWLSPDGKHIILMSGTNDEDGDNTRLSHMAVGDGFPRELGELPPSLPDLEWVPDWAYSGTPRQPEPVRDYPSPDGRRILRVSQMYGGQNCTMLTGDGSRIADFYVKAGDPIWAPDGSKVLFTDGLEVYDRNGVQLAQVGPGVRAVAGWDAETGGVLFFGTLPRTAAEYPPDPPRDWLTAEQIKLTPALEDWIAEVKTEAGAYVRLLDDGYRLVVISRGEKPTAGYAVEIEKWSTSDAGWQIWIGYADPAAGHAVADVITCPITMMALKDDGRPISVLLSRDRQHLRVQHYSPR